MNEEIVFWKELLEKELRFGSRDMFLGYRLRGLQNRLSGFFYDKPVDYRVFSKGGFRGKLLDVGCGPVSYFEGFPELDVVAVDPNLEGYAQANSEFFKLGEVNNVKYISGFLTNDAVFKADMIWCTNVLDHDENYRDILAPFSDLLTDAGVCLLQTDCRSRWNVNACHPGVFTQKELLATIKDLGFMVYYNNSVKGFHGEDSLYLLFGKPDKFQDIANQEFYNYHQKKSKE
ncbi:MAG: class I SAM-dependent methyltransferase [Verrucomicrobiota bacterium]